MRMQHGFSADIQGLRAVAVCLVVGFHIAPSWVPGGYVGVDVFFVLSGYLITRGLLQQLEAGTLHVREFYMRRILRLLPAALFVLIVVACLTPIAFSPSRWEDTAFSVIASALYVENWLAAFRSIDYLASEDDPSPVLHYWSLSIEEQFYLLWPLLLLAANSVASRYHLARAGVVAAAMALAVVASFCVGVYLIDFAGDNSGYFTTHSRAWELALGGLLASSTVCLPGRYRLPVRLVGLVLIVGAAFAMPAGAPFPGARALIPCLGAIAIIASVGHAVQQRVTVLNNPISTFLGDISYSIYLWHWPIIVFLPALGVAKENPLMMPVAVGLTLLLSWLTKVLVEDTFRVSHVSEAARPREMRRAAAAVFASAVPIALAGFSVAHSLNHQVALTAAPGAAVLFASREVPKGTAYVPSLAALKKERPVVYDRGCHVDKFSDTPIECQLVKQSGVAFDVLVVGDSHAAHWIPALERLAEQRGWNLTSQTKASCSLWLDDSLAQPAKSKCKAWVLKVLDYIALTKPDLVVWSWYSPTGPFDINNVFSVWKEIANAGAVVAAIPDTPRLPFSPGECILHNADCSVPAAKVLPKDPLHGVTPPEGTRIIDMTDAFCIAGSCPLIIGNVIVWRDRHHMTVTYSRSLAPELGRRLDMAVKAVISRGREATELPTVDSVGR